ncbi:M14 family metallopeptidase [Cellulophaga fucicola]|uniref:M14 family metallopeptidase n=1 Tax=Cellulophaga fucicola TaxID=76595 RepID=UPI003EB97848
MMNFEKIFKESKVKNVTGRYVTNEDVFPFLEQTVFKDEIKEIGKSVLNASIKMITIGHGKTKILMWSQMHGNESTTTKAVLDLIHFLEKSSDLSLSILKNCTLRIIPILNPDGAAAYTRINANKIDLNRDAQDRSQPESKILREVYLDFKPDFCFNLHDQRTIFNVGKTNKPATVSFLAPAFNKERGMSASRDKSMQLIVAMNSILQNYIPGQVGRYDDGFNSNCVGDAFQMLNTPTILFESGHYPEDYDREKTREFIFYSLLKGVETIVNNELDLYKVDSYFDIPENGKQFLDLIIYNTKSIATMHPKADSLGVLYKEVLKNGKVVFEPTIVDENNLDRFFAHKKLNLLVNSDLEYVKSNMLLSDCLLGN